LTRHRNPTDATAPDDILDFWFAAGPQRWFKKDPAFDAELTARFCDAANAAAAGAFDGWTASEKGTLALVILLDQFRRNIFRGTPDAFSADAKALAVATGAIDGGVDQMLPADQRQWLYLPFEHAEDLAVQQRSVALFEALGDAEALKWAVDHRDIIARFGRFPHRNAILGRAATAEEEAFLATGGFAG